MTARNAPSAPAPYPPIPYGQTHFKTIRGEGSLYVDKTRFVRELERHRYAFLIRPRRFGKTSWLSVLESYYDRNEAAAFDALFAGTEIGTNPTANRGRHVVLRFNFSAVNDALATLERSFENYCRLVFEDALARNTDLFPAPVAKRLNEEPAIGDKLVALFLQCRNQGIPLYILIDEYDNFAKTILTMDGAEAYHSFTHGGGFYRNFFATLKAGTENGSLDRLFVTGVSPITMDDVTSGFNIATNISLLPDFNELLGFTEAEVRGLLETYRDLGAFNQDVDAVLELMRQWYGGYRFAKQAEHTVHNTDMVLYYLHHSLPNKAGPEELIDANVRIDYGKLRHLLLTEQQLNGNFELLRETAGIGEVQCEIVHSFPLAELLKRENFLSLLYYFGLLSRGDAAAGATRLGMPNQTVRQLLYGHLRAAWQDVGLFSPDFLELQRLARKMAVAGEWHPAIERLAELVAEHTGIRDALQGEKAVQGFLAAYLSIANCFAMHTEMELGKGYADLVLAPLAQRDPSLRHGFVIEVKYLRRRETAARVPAMAEQAERQLRSYLADKRLGSLCTDVRFTGLALVFRGWELVHATAIGT